MEAEIIAAHAQKVFPQHPVGFEVGGWGRVERHTKRTYLPYGICEAALSEDTNQRRHFIPFIPHRPSAVTDVLQRLICAGKPARPR